MRLGLSGALVALVLIVAACGNGSSGAKSVPGPTTSAPVTIVPVTTAPSGPVTVSSSSGVPFEATLVVPGRIGRVNVSWPYVLHVTTLRGRPVKAHITVQIVDPLQQPHPVEYDRTTKKLIDWPIDGEFKDDVIWPPDSRGFTLTFRVIVDAKGGTTRLVVPVRVQ